MGNHSAGVSELMQCLLAGTSGWICRVDAQHASLKLVDELHRDGLRGLFACLQLLIEGKALAHERFMFRPNHVHGSTSFETRFDVV